MSQLKKLEDLDLSDNGEMISADIDIITTLTSLRALDLSSCSLTDLPFRYFRYVRYAV